MRRTFDQELKHLQDDILLMGSMTEKAVERSVEALRTRDVAMAKQVIADDAEINRTRFAIEDQCVAVIAQQQPMARDLRRITAALIIANELERMADHAQGIAKINVMMGAEPLLKPLVDIPRMAEKTIEMTHAALDAFVRGDVEQAKRVARDDDAVDALYEQVYRELLVFMFNDPHTITRATWLLWVAHNLERVGDRATNICERVVYMVSGELVEYNIS
ncbi:MAG: phosphate signaling complex protein PhoU [Chloroflexi bacterium]|nr:phosphate signaling complex protein PhoU [Chloroflexota bacterium]